MKDEYDFSKGRPNPYARQLKKQVTINLAEEVVVYFKAQAKELGIPYQTLINLYLADCAKEKRQPVISWG